MQRVRGRELYSPPPRCWPISSRAETWNAAMRSLRTIRPASAACPSMSRAFERRSVRVPARRRCAEGCDAGAGARWCGSRGATSEASRGSRKSWRKRPRSPTRCSPTPATCFTAGSRPPWASRRARKGGSSAWSCTRSASSERKSSTSLPTSICSSPTPKGASAATEGKPLPIRNSSRASDKSWCRRSVNGTRKGSCSVWTCGFAPSETPARSYPASTRSRTTTRITDGTGNATR